MSIRAAPPAETVTLAPDGTFPHLASASQRANALPAFAQTQWKG